MPWQIPFFIVVWVVAMGYYTWRTNERIQALNNKYIGTDLVFKFLQGRLPPEQQLISFTFLLVLVGSLCALALLIVICSIAYSP